MPDETFDAQWVVVEQLGHRRLAGRLTEQTIAGGGYLRLDVPDVDGHLASTHLLAHSSIYAIHPVTETVARAVAVTCRPAPVQRYELAAPEPDRGLDRLDLARLAEMIPVEHTDHTDGRPDRTCLGCIAATLDHVRRTHGLGLDDEPETWTNVDEDGPF